jgi:hypothetical protein
MENKLLEDMWSILNAAIRPLPERPALLAFENVYPISFRVGVAYALETSVISSGSEKLALMLSAEP